MQHLLYLSFIISPLILLQHCSNSASTTVPTVELFTELTTSTIRNAIQFVNKNEVMGSSPVDSLAIDRVRMVVRRLKLHTVEDDSAGNDIKTDAFILTFIPQQSWVTSATIPIGTYRWMKLELHRLSNEEAEFYASNPEFADIIVPERYSVIIEGKVYPHGNVQPTAFTYRSTITAAVALKLDPPSDVASHSILQLVAQFDPSVVFRSSNGYILHPLDPDNRSTIENNIKSALKVLKQ